jgi:hypothetical protein
VDQRDNEYGEMRDIWSDYNRRQEFEHDLINRKTTWLLTAETILFAAYGVSFGEATADDFRSAAKFRDAVAWSGLLIAVIMLIGVVSVINSKRMSWRLYRGFFKESGSSNLPRPLDRRPLAWGVHTGNNLLTLVPDFVLPIVIIGAWGYLLGLA